MASFTIPKSRIDQFYATVRSDGRRLGEKFYYYIEADKMLDDKHWLDRLYCADGAYAQSLIHQVTDYNC